MATKKTAKRKQTTSEQATRGKLVATKKTSKKKAVGKRQPSRKQSVSKSAHKKETVKAVRKKVSSKRRGPVRKRSQTTTADSFSAREAASRSAGQSGDLQGLSDVATADSESADELLEEGNAFEAGVVTGVEDAERAVPSEVHTHEVLEDDVPEEYLNPD
jgi:methylmalonyl-CoA mutase N-terminal domain/subunit